YRTRAPTSQVDETLFGSPNPVSFFGLRPANKNLAVCFYISKVVIFLDHCNWSSSISGVIYQIPLKDPSGESIILPTDEFERINSAAQVLSKEDREALKEAYQRRKEEEMQAAEERKHQIYVADQCRKENYALTELELEAQNRAQRLVERANTLRMEQEDEIKNLNKLILSAQCQATRDAQIQEKKQIQVELLEEEKRLDAMMEVERRKALETMEKIAELRKQQRIGGMQEIYNQIQQRMEEKQLENEVKEQEREQIRENQDKINLEDLKALEKKRQEQQRLHEEVMRINAEAMRTKLQRREEEKLADMRDMEFVKKKLEREAEYEAEQRRIKKDKELEIARLRAQQEKVKDYKAEQDELRARRNQEITERQWRKKEKELAEKKAREEAMLKAARLEQVQRKEHLLSIEAGREKATFERVLKAQQEAIVKRREEEEKQHQKALRHSEAIRQQMKERELSAITKRREIFEEADRLNEEARQRRARLNEIKEKKLKELK
uniref:Cilia- and flagella-associated protein 45 n=1 Tax=Mastacembelus armatus TaxID=205130 RepID=A0A3Q3M0J3_9TELE